MLFKGAVSKDYIFTTISKIFGIKSNCPTGQNVQQVNMSNHSQNVQLNGQCSQNVQLESSGPLKFAKRGSKCPIKKQNMKTHGLIFIHVLYDILHFITKVTLKITVLKSIEQVFNGNAGVPKQIQMIVYICITSDVQSSPLRKLLHLSTKLSRTFKLHRIFHGYGT